MSSYTLSVTLFEIWNTCVMYVLQSRIEIIIDLTRFLPFSEMDGTA